MGTEFLFFLALGVLVFGLVSRRLETTSLTPPMFFSAIGFLVAVAFRKMMEGEHGASDSHSALSPLHLMAEITLIVVLFTDASRIDLRRLRHEAMLPGRLLGLGLPLTIVLGAATATWILPGLTFWEAALLAAILAPTDAALGQAVVSSEAVPVRIRQSLNVESGLNDGIVLPAVILLMCAAGAHQELHGYDYWIRFAGLQVTLGPLLGVVVGLLGGRLIEGSASAGWMNGSFKVLSVLGLSVLAFASAELVGGNGFIASFVAGLVLGNSTKSLGSSLHEFGEAEGQLLTLITFSLFGALMLPEALTHASVDAWIYAGLSLTIIRMLPVAIAMLGTGCRKSTIGFLGWFGPRGIASVLFLLLVIEEGGLAGQTQIEHAVILTVALSILAHGISAAPGARLYAASLRTTSSTLMENHPEKSLRDSRTTE